MERLIPRAGYLSEFFVCFWELVILATDFVIMKCRLMGRETRRFFLRHTTTTSLLGFASWTSSFLTLSVREDILMAD